MKPSPFYYQARLPMAPAPRRAPRDLGGPVRVPSDRPRRRPPVSAAVAVARDEDLAPVGADR